MTHETVQHYVSVHPDGDLITRARIVSGRTYDDVSLFAADRLVSNAQLPKGQGSLLCEQLGLISRVTEAATLAQIERTFVHATEGK